MTLQIDLKAKSAREARQEIQQLAFPKGANYKGYDKNGNCVLMSQVREKGNKAYVATARKNRSLPAIRFVCEPL